jgi:MOSC domain-containing protein YiiM
MTPADPAAARLISVNLGIARPLLASGRRVLSAIGKEPVAGPVAVVRLGLAFWQAKRLEHSVSLWDEVLPSGFVGENLSLQGLLEAQVWVGDELHFPGCVLRVTAPREPCYKFNAVMGYPQAARDMMLAGCCGFYLAVKQGGTIEAGQYGTLVPGQRGLSIAEAFQARRIKHLR